MSSSTVATPKLALSDFRDANVKISPYIKMAMQRGAVLSQKIRSSFAFMVRGESEITPVFEAAATCIEDKVDSFSRISVGMVADVPKAQMRCGGENFIIKLMRKARKKFRSSLISVPR